MLYLCCTQTKKPLNFERFYDCNFTVEKVQAERLELSHLAAPDPKSGVSTNSTTPASICNPIKLVLHSFSEEGPVFVKTRNFGMQI